MRNPFKNEESAFRFVLGTIVYFALIVVTSLVAAWLGFLTFVVLTVGALILLRGGKPAPPLHEHIEHDPVEDTWRILVVANETLEGDHLRREIMRMSEGVAEDVFVVCPALNSPVRTWTSDEDGARDAAGARLDATLQAFADVGIAARGQVGDGDPLQALEDALRSFSADEIIISTHPVGSSNWLERGVVASARVRFDVPVIHVIGDTTIAHPPEVQPGDGSEAA